MKTPKKKKKFIQLIQKFHTTAIIEVSEDESDESIMKRITEHCKNAGGAEVVICQGGEITFDFEGPAKALGRPTKKDEDDFECID